MVILEEQSQIAENVRILCLPLWTSLLDLPSIPGNMLEFGLKFQKIVKKAVGEGLELVFKARTFDLSELDEIIFFFYICR